MKKIFKNQKISKVALSIVLCFSLAVMPIAIPTQKAHADVTNYIDKTKQTVDTTNKIINALGVDKWGAMGAAFSSFTSYLSKGLGYTNTILKFFGLGKKKIVSPTLEELIYREVVSMHNELNEMSKKLDMLTNDFANFQAEVEFKSLMQESDKLYDRWFKFNQDYIENGMEHYLKEYQGKIMDSMLTWCRNDSDSARNKYGIDNTQIVIAHDPTINDEGMESLVLSRDNQTSADLQNYRYVIIKGDCLPNSLTSCNADNYKDKISSYISDKIRNALDTGAGIESLIEVKDFPIFTYDGWKLETDANKNTAIDDLCSDVIDVLNYRNSVIVANTDTSFVRDAVTCFDNYCSNLTGTQKYGLDALLQSIHLSSGFEGQARQNLENVLGGLAARTSEYATFALDLIGKADSITKDPENPQSQLNATVDNWNNSINVIDSAINNGISGYDDYCYLTNSRLKVEAFTFSIAVGYACDSDGNNKRDFYEYHSIPDTGASQFIGSSGCMLLSNLFSCSTQSSGIESDFPKTFSAYVNKFCSNANLNDSSVLLGSWSSDVEKMTDGDNDVKLWYKFLEGQPDPETITYAQLNKNNFKDRNYKVVGDIINTDSPEILKNEPLICCCADTTKKGTDKYCDTRSTISGGGVSPFFGSSNAKYGSEFNAKNFKYYTFSKVPIEQKVNLTKSVNLVGSYNPLQSLQDLLDGKGIDNTKAGTAFGTGNVVLIGVLCLIGGLLIGGSVTYAFIRNKKKEK